MKYPHVRQHNQEDCGAACLAMISRFYGRIFTINRIRETVGTIQTGTTLLGLKRGSEALGFYARGMKVGKDFLQQMQQFPLPAIIHWKGYHWIVLYGKRGKKYIVGDPAIGLRYLTQEELLQGWRNGVILLLQPDEYRFFAQESDKIEGFGRFVRRAFPYRWILLQAITINIIIGVLSLTSPFLTQILTDDVLVRGDTNLLTIVALGVISLNLFSNVIGVVQSFLLGYFGQRMQLGLLMEYGYKLLHLPLSYFESHRSGEVTGRLADVRTVNTLVQRVLLQLPSQFFTSLISLGFMLSYSWQLTAVSFLGFLLMTIVNLLFMPTQRRRNREAIALRSESQGFLVETFRGIQVLKTTQATPQAQEEYQQNFGRLAHLNWSTMKLSVFSKTLTNILSKLTSVTLLWMGSYLVINRTLTIGQLLAFTAMSSNFISFLNFTVGLGDDLITAQLVIERLTEVLDATPERSNEEKKAWTEISGSDDIVCTQLNFHHPGRRDLLKDFSVTLPGGNVIALIGKSGCGKSTLVKLLAGLYSLESGNIRIGMYNHSDLSLDCLRQQVVLVPQDAHFWKRSIVDNFHFSYPQVTFQQIVKACCIAGADEFISEMPDKYQTVLGEFGANLSGGQRQRLALARGIVTEPPILILDESTAALDPQTEAEVLDELLSKRQGKMTIIISHRPRVIERADWVILLEKGELKLQGTVNELRAQDGEHQCFLMP
ncbi:peptidase domain-containing ABC transporter [Calothrix sp. FACHB-1219]|uniref:peptidase domain-containing ABC transporter n=1 Tax=unclassified Calothrix TaxID=2619626 RepID=UPI0016846FD9|nr:MULTISPECIES: peptidase domain-containing ABC transporter [unclassified Calothrix]MBD2207473.1 peptidase domain-containing ABC transporter [Calothrix sp. FACHB-168]MBD2222025.1 peptidase domain-containing ABC transporter [Calothrix sp. FACHB-1219]